MRCINNEPSSILKIVEFAEMRTQKEFGFFYSEISCFQEFGNKKVESAVEIRCRQPWQMIQ